MNKFCLWILILLTTLFIILNSGAGVISGFGVILFGLLVFEEKIERQ